MLPPKASLWLKSNWILLVALAIIFTQLFMVHRHYTGIVQTIRGPVEVSGSSSPYPFFSDEWVTVALIKYSTANHALPIVNPFNHNEPFPNLLFAFPTFLSIIFFLTGLNPLTTYWIFAILFGLILCASVYILLRAYNVSSYIAAATVLFIPYITNSGNLPALWSLLPVTFGIILFLWQLTANKKEKYLTSIIFTALALLFYPPMVVFVVPCLLISIWQRKDKSANVKPFLISAIVLVIIFYLIATHAGLSIGGIFSKYLIRPNLDSNIISYGIWNIVPLLAIFLALPGIYVIYKNKYFDLAITLAVGFIFWIMYAFVNKVFIIEYTRIVFIASIFIIIAAGLAADNFIPKKWSMYLSVGMIIVVLSLLPWYTASTKWQKLTLTTTDSAGHSKIFKPASPVNRYLTDEDLKLFADIHGTTFLAPHWKGLVLGTATDNWPLETKTSTITNQLVYYGQFMSLDCNGRTNLAQIYKIDYIYGAQFACQSFVEVGNTKEGFYLYRFEQK